MKNADHDSENGRPASSNTFKLISAVLVIAPNAADSTSDSNESRESENIRKTDNDATVARRRPAGSVFIFIQSKDTFPFEYDRRRESSDGEERQTGKTGWVWVDEQVRASSIRTGRKCKRARSTTRVLSLCLSCGLLLSHGKCIGGGCRSVRTENYVIAMRVRSEQFECWRWILLVRGRAFSVFP